MLMISSSLALTSLFYTLSFKIYDRIFPIKDLGHLHYFLSVEALQDDCALFLSQQKYIFDLLKKTNMINAKPVNSPMSPTANLSMFKGDPFCDLTLYRSTIGSLQYLSFTRPDLTFTISKVCQFM